jgi:hypothetical protein
VRQEEQVPVATASVLLLLPVTRRCPKYGAFNPEISELESASGCSSRRTFEEVLQIFTNDVCDASEIYVL